MIYYTYILRCQDKSLYTGITTDLERRFKEHSLGQGLGAKYTKVHQPLKFECAWSSENRSLASKLETRIKALSKKEKEDLIALGHLPQTLSTPKLDISLYKKADLPKNMVEK